MAPTHDTASDHCFSLVFNTRKESPLDQRVVQRPRYTQENLVTDLTLSEPQDYIYFGQFEGPSFDGTLKTLTPSQSQKNY